MRRHHALLSFLFAGVPLAAQDASTRYYWDMDTVDGGGTPVDLVGNLPNTAGANLDLAHTAYGQAGGFGGDYLHTDVSSPGIPLTADVYDTLTDTEMVFGGDFSFSYWSYDDSSDGQVQGPRVFDCLFSSTQGIQLGSDASGIFNYRMDDDAFNFVLSNGAGNLDTLAQPDDVWTFVVVNVSRTTDTAEIFFNGISRGTYGISALTGPLKPSQDLQIGVINNGDAVPNDIQNAGLDDLAFYDGLLGTPEIAGLFAGTITPLDLYQPPAHYWDFQTDNGGDSIPDDLHGGLAMSEPNGVTTREIDTFYGEAFSGADRSLNSQAGDTLYLQAETHDGTRPTALNFGIGSFAFSFWSFDHSDDTTTPPGDGNPFGAQIFDCLNGTTTGIQLGTDSSGYFNLRLDDDADKAVISNQVAGFEMVKQPSERWVHVAVNIDRQSVPSVMTIYFDGVAIPQGPIDISPLTGNIFCSQDLQIGVRNGGGTNGSQKNGLDDLAFYPGLLSQEQITALAAATTTPLDILRISATPGTIPIVSVDYAAGELTVVFSSESGLTYSVFGGQVPAEISSWPEVSTMEINGDGTDLEFSHTPGVSPFFIQVRED